MLSSTHSPGNPLSRLLRRRLAARRIFIVALALLGGSISSIVTRAQDSMAGTAVVDKVTTWKIENPKSIGSLEPEVLGEPKPTEQDGRHALVFNGKDTGLIFPSNPIAGLSQFTIEVLFAPDPHGEEAQRFLHIEDDKGNRGLMEIRIKDGSWSLDTFLNSATSKLTLLDRAKVHPAGKWTWVALVYDGKAMRSYINGVKELEGPVAFPATGTGKMSLGVRLNKVYWFKGAVSEIRFHSTAVEDSKLQKE